MDLKKVVEDLIESFLNAGDLAIELRKKGLIKEAILKEHCRFEAGYKDVIIHSIYNPH